MTQTTILHHHCAPHVEGLPLPTDRGWVAAALSSEKIRRSFRNLEGWPLSETAVPKVTPVEPARNFEPVDLRVLEGSRVSQLGIHSGRTHPVNLLEFADVYLWFETSGFILFDRNGLSPWSTGLPKFGMDEMDKATPCNAVFLTADRFSPTNISHFTYDHLGRGVLAREILGLSDNQISFVDETPYSRHVLDRAFANGVRLSFRKPYHFKKLLMFRDSFWFMCHPANYCDPRIIKHLHEALTPTVSQRSGRIFITRKDVGHRRPMVNEDELRQFLEANGYRTILPVDYTPEEQLALFASAESIVSAHGAALTSIIACSPGTRVRELFSPHEGTAAYAAISHSLDLDYRAEVGREFGTEGAWSLDREKFPRLLS